MCHSRRTLFAHPGKAGRIEVNFHSPIHNSWYVDWQPRDGESAIMIFNPYFFLRLLDRREYWLSHPRKHIPVGEKLDRARRITFDPTSLSEIEWMRYFSHTTRRDEQRRIYELSRITWYIEAYEVI